MDSTTTRLKELQARARESLEEMNQKALERARAAGADEALIAFDGLSPQMIEALVADDVKTLDDFATLADWELAGGYTETADGKRVKDDGILESFEVSIDEARNLIMSARVALGLVDPDALMALVESNEEDGEAADAEEATDAEEAEDENAVATEDGVDPSAVELEKR